MSYNNYIKQDNLDAEVIKIQIIVIKTPTEIR